jgi:UDP-N-acetylmuramoyl-tripeptide--D-alanyl-D-alanine ligase
MSAPALWKLDAMQAAMKARPSGAPPAAVTGLSIDSRTIAPGEAFFAVKDTRDGHDFVPAALAAGAGVAVVAEGRQASMPANAPLLIVPDVLEALRALACASRARSNAHIAAITGSVGKTGTKEALRLALGKDGETHASVASYNNHWGVPLSLARMSQSARYGVFEIGMNHAGEIEPLVKLARPHVAVVTNVEPVHLEYFGSIEKIADAKAEIFLGVEAGGAALINRDNAQCERLARAAKAAGITRIVTFGEHADADARLVKVSLHAECSAVEANILGTDVTYKIAAPGRHFALNSLAVLATASLLGADLALAALALAEVTPASGRGARVTLDVPGGTALLIDESYNANPASMGAALALLGQARLGPQGRRIAVLGDMLELGPKGAKLHTDLVEPILANAVDLVFCSGPLMRGLWNALPSERRGGCADTAAALEPQVIAAVRAGDAIMVKGSLGSAMGPIVKALARRYSRHEAHAEG